jgi:glycosyltransferase involved in cell wall biosynthesis
VSLPADQRPGTVAVVIPFFDDAATIGDAVASVRAQDVPAQIIVVDDGSTQPQASALLAQLQDEGVVVFHQANAGPAAARTAGVHAASADYVLPLDADDALAPGALRRLRDVLDRHPETVAAWGSVRHFGALAYAQRSRAWLDPWQVSYQNHLPLSALYRRDAVLDAGGWQFQGGYEDWDLWMTLAERGWKGIGIPAVTGYYRVHAGRRLGRSSRRHAERYAKLRARHPQLFADRRRHRRASPAPALLKATLPAVHALPASPHHKRLLSGALTHVAYREGWTVLAARFRAYRFLRATPASTPGGDGPS